MDFGPTKTRAILLLAGALVSYGLASAMPWAASPVRVFAYVLAFVGLVMFEHASGGELASNLRIGALVATWITGAYIYATKNPPPAAAYLLLFACIGATIGFFDNTMRIQTRRMAYGLVVLAFVWPSLFALLSNDAFEKVFGIGAGKPMGAAGILAFGIYFAGLFVAPAIPDRPLPPMTEEDDEPKSAR